MDRHRELAHQILHAATKLCFQETDLSRRRQLLVRDIEGSEMITNQVIHWLRKLRDISWHCTRFCTGRFLCVHRLLGFLLQSRLDRFAGFGCFLLFQLIHDRFHLVKGLPQLHRAFVRGSNSEARRMIKSWRSYLRCLSGHSYRTNSSEGSKAISATTSSEFAASDGTSESL